MKQKKPKWVVQKERDRRAAAAETVWLFGIHAVRDALANPMRERLRLVVTKNASDRLAEDIAASGMEAEISDPRKFAAPGSLSDICAPRGQPARVILLDRVTDPHNVGAILRSAEVFGARAVIAPHRHSAPETGALAKTASGALERQPYLRVKNLATTMEALREMGYSLIGLDGEAEVSLRRAVSESEKPIALVLGAEGPGLREKTKDTCDTLARLDASGSFGSLNVSNAAAVSLYEVQAKD